MKNRIGIIVLILICVGLSVALIWDRNQAAEQRRTAADSIGNYSNQLVQTRKSFDDLHGVNMKLEEVIAQERQTAQELSNTVTELVAALEQNQATLKQTREELAQREQKITELENQNQVLDERALDLSNAITNLTAQIDDTRGRLAASEGDKAFLEKELQRLIAEKAELERQFNDLAALRTQVAKLKEELTIARRIEWIRQGLFARSEQKGAEQLLTSRAATSATPPARRYTYDLNVEIGADGTVRVIPPPTNSAAAPANIP